MPCSLSAVDFKKNHPGMGNALGASDGRQGLIFSLFGRGEYVADENKV